MIWRESGLSIVTKSKAAKRTEHLCGQGVSGLLEIKVEYCFKSNSFLRVSGEILRLFVK